MTINLFWRKLKKCTPEQAHDLATELSADLLTNNHFQGAA
jgi:hypothetical protein